MRFTLVKDLSKNDSMKWALNPLLLFTSLYLIVDIFVKKMSFGISVAAVEFTLFGNEEEFLDPITESSFLEFIHTDIFFIMMILLTLSAVYIRLTEASKAALFIVNITMLSAIISLISLGLSFYLSSSFVTLYLASFFIWHILSFYMTLYSLWKLNAKSL